MSVPYVAFNCSFGGLPATVVTLYPAPRHPPIPGLFWPTPALLHCVLVLSPDFVCDFISVIQSMDSMVASHPTDPLIFQ